MLEKLALYGVEYKKTTEYAFLDLELQYRILKNEILESWVKQK